MTGDEKLNLAIAVVCVAVGAVIVNVAVYVAMRLLGMGA